MFTDNVFNLNSDVFNNISSILLTKILSLYDYEDISSAYITSYKNSKDIGQLNLTILIKDDANIYFYKRIVNKINDELYNYFCFPILFCVDYESEYNPNVNKSSSIIRIEELLNSDIIFDKNNILTDIKNNNSKDIFTYNFELIDFNPSFSQEIAFRLFRKLQWYRNISFFMQIFRKEFYV